MDLPPGGTCLEAQVQHERGDADDEEHDVVMQVDHGLGGRGSSVLEPPLPRDRGVGQGRRGHSQGNGAKDGGRGLRRG